VPRPDGPGLQTRLAPVPSSLGAKKQVQVLLELAATSAFETPPTLALRYAVAKIPARFTARTSRWTRRLGATSSRSRGRATSRARSSPSGAS
jgi:hypothetical protein